MNDEITEIIREQSKKLPRGVVSYLASSEWDSALGRIAKESGVDDDFEGIERATIVILLGLVHPDTYRGLLGGILSAQDTVINAFATRVDQEIFTPIRPALIEFLNTERAAAEARGEFPAEEGALLGLAPSNIPTGIKEEPLLPPLTPKVIQPKAPAPEVILMHPFEEKLQSTPVAAVAPTPSAMPATFTPAPAPITPTPVAPVAPATLQGTGVFTPASNGSPRGTLTHDPYRESVE